VEDLDTAPLLHLLRQRIEFLHWVTLFNIIKFGVPTHEQQYIHGGVAQILAAVQQKDDKYNSGRQV
jgi:hypothetical protein